MKQIVDENDKDKIQSISSTLHRKDSYLGMKKEGWIETFAMLRVHGKKGLLEEAIERVQSGRNLVNGKERLREIQRKWKESEIAKHTVTLTHHTTRDEDDETFGIVANYVASQMDCCGVGAGSFGMKEEEGHIMMEKTRCQLVRIIRVCGVKISTSPSSRSRNRTDSSVRSYDNNSNGGGGDNLEFLGLSSKARRRLTISDLGERRYLCHTVDCTGSRVDVVVPWYQITGRVIHDDTLIRVICHDELERGDVVEWTRDIAESMGVSMETRYHQCLHCNTEHDDHSRECVECGSSYCRSCKKDKMHKLKSKMWRCNTCQEGFKSHDDGDDDDVHARRKTMFGNMFRPFRMRASWLSSGGA